MTDDCPRPPHGAPRGTPAHQGYPPHEPGPQGRQPAGTRPRVVLGLQGYRGAAVMPPMAWLGMVLWTRTGQANGKRVRILWTSIGRIREIGRGVKGARIPSRANCPDSAVQCDRHCGVWCAVCANCCLNGVRDGMMDVDCTRLWCGVMRRHGGGYGQGSG